MRKKPDNLQGALDLLILRTLASTPAATALFHKGKVKERTIEFSVTMSAEGQEVTIGFTGEVAANPQRTAAKPEGGKASTRGRMTPSLPTCFRPKPIQS